MKPDTRSDLDLAGDTGDAHGWHWPGNSLLYLCAAFLAAVIGLGAWLMSDQKTGSIAGFAAADGHSVVPVVDQAPQRIKSIKIESEGEAILLRRDSGHWRLASSHGYPVRDDRVAPMLQMIGGLHALYVSKESPPPYRTHGLTGIEDPTGRSVRITFADADEKALGEITLGASVSAPGDGHRNVTAFMRPGDSRIWLAEGNLEIAAGPLDWIDNNITDMAENRILGLETVAPGGHRMAYRREGAGRGLEISEGIPPQASLKEPWRPNELAKLLSHMRFFDVQPADQFDPSAHDLWRVRVHATNGVTFHMVLFPVDMGIWTIVRAEAAPGADTTEAAKFNTRHRRWAYLLDDYAAKRLMVRSSELLQKTPTEP